MESMITTASRGGMELSILVRLTVDGKSKLNPSRHRFRLDRHFGLG